MRWPGVISAGAVTSQQTCFYDYLKTIAELASVFDTAIPPYIDGYSFAPTLLRGDGVQPQPEFIYHEYAGGLSDPYLGLPQYENISKSKFGQNIRWGNWSGVCVKAKDDGMPCTGDDVHSRLFLYNMSTFAGQKQLPQDDVAEAFPAVVEKMQALMKQEHNKHWPPVLPGGTCPGHGIIGKRKCLGYRAGFNNTQCEAVGCCVDADKYPKRSSGWCYPALKPTTPTPAPPPTPPAPSPPPGPKIDKVHVVWMNHLDGMYI